MKLKEQTVYIEIESFKTSYVNNGDYNINVERQEGYFLTEQELRELLAQTFEDGHHLGETWALFWNTDSVSRQVAESIEDKDTYINNLLKEE